MAGWMSGIIRNFKLPLPGNLSWQVNNEVGGYECSQSSYDQYHDGLNYFAVDITWATTANAYSSTSNVPIIAASGGKIVTVNKTDSTDPNGYYVVVDHDGDGNLNTGFSTRYLHLQYGTIPVSVGDTVAQGDRLGYMGNSGFSQGKHLHFGMRYANSGADISNVRYAVIDGWLMKSIQTECNSSNYWARYYASSNRAY